MKENHTDRTDTATDRKDGRTLTHPNGIDIADVPTEALRAELDRRGLDVEASIELSRPVMKCADWCTYGPRFCEGDCMSDTSSHRVEATGKARHHDTIDLTVSRQILEDDRHGGLGHDDLHSSAPDRPRRRGMAVFGARSYGVRSGRVSQTEWKHAFKRSATGTP